YLSQLDTADRQEPSEALAMRPRGSKRSSPGSQRRCGASKARGAGARGVRSADVAYRYRFPLDRDERTRLRCRRLQRAGRGYTEHHLIVTHEMTNVGSDRSRSRVSPRKPKPRCKLIL